MKTRTLLILLIILYAVSSLKANGNNITHRQKKLSELNVKSSIWLGLGRSTLFYFDDYKQAVSTGIEFAVRSIAVEFTGNYSNETHEEYWQLNPTDHFTYSQYTRDGILDFIVKYDFLKGNYDGNMYLGTGLGVSFTRLRYLQDFAYLNNVVSNEHYAYYDYKLITIPVLADVQFRLWEKFGLEFRGTLNYSVDPLKKYANYQIQDGNDLRVGSRKFGTRTALSVMICGKYYL